MMGDLKRPAEEIAASVDARKVFKPDATCPDAINKEARRPKHKVGVLIGYCGTGYHGMQVNPPHQTIEGELFKAFVKAGAISKDNSDDPKKSSLIRAARTDKGVHAAGNVVSLKLIVEDEDIVEKINAHLPEQIRVWGYTKTNKSFECRKNCSSRVYEYVLPSYTLMAPKPSTPLGQRLPHVLDRVKNDELEAEAAGFWANVQSALQKEGITEEDVLVFEKEDAQNDLTNSSEHDIGQNDESQLTPRELKRKQAKAIENAQRRAYRVGAVRLERLQKALTEYEGVHNFHNYTVGKNFKDPSAMRVMKTLTVSEPKIIDGTEWISIKIHGQSFMLHQIRKMIAMAVLTVRTGVPVSRISGLYADVKLGIPKAPALGLLLEQPRYDAYNERLIKLGREPISFEPYETQMESFKNKYVYDRIHSQEAKENEFHAFFAFIDTYRASDLLDYLTGAEVSPDWRGDEPAVPVPDDIDETDLVTAVENEG